jgi:hypothetical protein
MCPSFASDCHRDKPTVTVTLPVLHGDTPAQSTFKCVRIREHAHDGRLGWALFVCREDPAACSAFAKSGAEWGRRLAATMQEKVSRLGGNRFKAAPCMMLGHSTSTMPPQLLRCDSLHALPPLGSPLANPTTRSSSACNRHTMQHHQHLASACKHPLPAQLPPMHAAYH